MADEKQQKKGGGEGAVKKGGGEGAAKKGGGDGAKKAAGKKAAAPKAEAAKKEPRGPEEKVEPRKRRQYFDAAIAALTKQFAYTNPMQVPRLQKIVINMGLGAAVQNPKIIDSAVEELGSITGQKPVVTRAKKAIATFKLREGMPIGATVTLRRERMWEFLDRLVSVALPRVRDFKGVTPRGFDGQGNYTLGLREQIIFPEIDYDKIDAIKGMNISFVTTAKTDEEGRALLAQLGMPFRA